MKYIVDEIIEDNVVLEEFDTKKMINVNRNLLPKDIHDGSVLLYQDDEYILDNDGYKSRLELIQEKLNRVKNIKKSDVNE